MIEDLAPQVEEQAVETPVVDKPVEQPSLRESLGKALEESKDSPEVKAERKAERARAEDGKFVKGGKTESTKTAPEPKQPQSAAAPVVSVSAVENQSPPAFTGAIKAKWQELPPEVRQELSKREQDVHRTITTQGEEVKLARQFKEIVAPYIAQMRAENAEPIGAVKSLLNTAYILRSGNHEQKRQLILDTARAYGVDLFQGNTQQAQQQVHPVLQQTWQELQSMKADREREIALRKQQEDASIQSQISAFSADPKNAHFETVRAEMAALLSGGIAKDLQDAYDRAVYSNPQTRASQLEALNRDSQEKRVADQKAKAEAAKKAGSSIKGSPGMAATRDPKIQSADLNSTIRAAFAEARGNA